MVKAAVVEKKSGKKAVKAPAKKAARSESGPANYGMDRTKDLPMSEKKAKLLKTLKKLGEADSKHLADAAGLSGRDVRHYGYHARAGGLIEINQYEHDEATGFGGGNKYYFKLTAAGKKLDIDKELAAVNAKKAEKKPKEATKAPKAGKAGKGAGKKAK